MAMPVAGEVDAFGVPRGADIFSEPLYFRAGTPAAAAKDVIGHRGDDPAAGRFAGGDLLTRNGFQPGYDLGEL